MADERNGMARGLMIGFLAGTVVGAITALLYAPKSGKELRSEIKHRANELADDAEEYLKAARAKGIDIMNQGKTRSDQLISDAKEKAGLILDDAEKVLSGIRERAGAEQNRAKAAFRAGVDAYKGEKNRESGQRS